MIKIARYNKNRRKNDPFDESMDLNMRTYQSYYNRLMGLCISRFKWINLPETIDETMLETFLFMDGKVLFFEDEVLGFLALQSTIEGALNVYRIPLNRRAYAVNGYNRKLNIKNSVLIFNDVLRNNSMNDCELYARRLMNLDRTMDVNIASQKTPTLILCDENQRLVMENLYMKYDGNQPFIFGNDKLDIKGIQALKTDAPFVAPQMQVLKSDLWQEALTHLGIVNVNDDKKERLITSEVEIGNVNVVAQQNIWLNARKKACEQINSMFNLNIDVEFREMEVKQGDEIYDTSKDDM